MHTLHLYQFVLVSGNPKEIVYYFDTRTKRNKFYFSQISDFRLIDIKYVGDVEYSIIKIVHSLGEHIIALELSTFEKIRTNYEASMSDNSAITNWDVMSSKNKVIILNDLIRIDEKVQPFSSDDKPSAFTFIS